MIPLSPMLMPTSGRVTGSFANLFTEKIQPHNETIEDSINKGQMQRENQMKASDAPGSQFMAHHDVELPDQSSEEMLLEG